MVYVLFHLRNKQFGYTPNLLLTCWGTWFLRADNTFGVYFWPCTCMLLRACPTFVPLFALLSEQKHFLQPPALETSGPWPPAREIPGKSLAKTLPCFRITKANAKQMPWCGNCGPHVSRNAKDSLFHLISIWKRSNRIFWGKHPGKNYITAPPSLHFFGQNAFFRERVGGVYVSKPPVAGFVLYAPHP